MKPVLVVAFVMCLAACQTDPFCRRHNAATFGPSREAWRTMTPAEREAAGRSFNEAARRCGWEP
ncbi:hypothetical protein [Enterovirga aerilata]|uniref:Uncharacterized protein n=1 Tax=Enterovirga aerilata TaxID=2730920 RepID=A0A849ID16_9HYPH|nr:hypothetical protein [Enterovirga sp. DB1703]NNM74309.1 hypothetical protein [Enterovirga sp. DB1703]